MINQRLMVWIFLFVLPTTFSRGEPEPEPNPDPIKVHQFFFLAKDVKDGSLGSACTSPSQCLVKNSVCKYHTCACDDGFVQDAKQCVQPGSLGSTCSTHSDCPVLNSSCTDNTCGCDNRFVQDGNECLEEKWLDDLCQKTVQCPEHSECTTTCVCQPDYISVSSECMPKLSLLEECTYDIQCSSKIINSECRGVSVKLCSCEGDLVAATDGSCMAATIGLRLEQPLNDIYDANMATFGSAEYMAILDKLLLVYADIPGYVSLTEMTIEDDGSGKVLTKFLYHIVNPQLQSLRVRRELGGDVVSNVKAAAQSRGYHGSTVRLERGGLHQYCSTSEDCAVADSVCVQSVCICTFGADVYGRSACKEGW